MHGGLAANVITYNAVISVCEKGQQAQQASSVTTYNALISACEKASSLTSSPTTLGFARYPSPPFSSFSPRGRRILNPTPPPRHVDPTWPEALGGWFSVGPASLIPSGLGVAVRCRWAAAARPAPPTRSLFFSSPLPPSLPSPPALHRFTGGCHFPQCGQRLVREGPAATTGAAVVTGLITFNAPISACEKGQQSKQALQWLRELRFP